MRYAKSVSEDSYNDERPNRLWFDLIKPDQQLRVRMLNFDPAFSVYAFEHLAGVIELNPEGPNTLLVSYRRANGEWVTKVLYFDETSNVSKVSDLTPQGYVVGSRAVVSPAPRRATRPVMAPA